MSVGGSEGWMSFAPNPASTTGPDVFNVVMGGADCQFVGTGTETPFYTENIGAILMNAFPNHADPYTHTGAAYVEASLNTAPQGNDPG